MGGARSEGQGGPQARARKRALSLTAVSAPACSNRSTKAILALDRQHGIYREHQNYGTEKIALFWRVIPVQNATHDLWVCAGIDGRPER